MKLSSWFSRKLVRRLVAPSLFLGVLAVILLSLITYVTVHNLLEKSVSDQLRVAADLQENELKRWIDDQKTTAVFISRAPFVRERVVDLLSREKDHPYYQRSYRELSEFLFSYIKNFPGLREIMLLKNRGGQVIFSTTPEHEGEFWANDTFFLEGQEDLFIQGVYPWRETTQPTITVARPLLDAVGEKKGVLAVHLNLERMEQVVSQHPELGQKGEVYLVDKFNTFINADRFGREGFSRVHTEGIDRAVAGEEGIRYYRNYLDVPVLGYYRWLPELEVAILAEINQADAFQAAEQLGLIIGSLGLSLIVCLVVGNTFFAKRIAQPLEEMAEMAQRVAAGDFTAQISIEEEDETGVLANALNQMMNHLQSVYDEMGTTAEYFKTIFNLNPSAASVQRFDDGTFVQVNEGFCQMFGVEAGGVLGRSSRELHIFQSDFSRLRLAAHLKENAGIADFEASFVRSDGEVFAGIISSRAIDLSGEKHVVSILVDLSDIRQAEQELREITDRLQLLIDRMPIGCITWNDNFTVEFWNPAAEKIFGYSSAEAVGRHAYELIVPAEIKPIVDPVWKKLLAGDETAHSANENVTRDGRTIFCDWYNTPLKNPEGESIGVISMVRDITAQKAAEDNLIYQKDLLQTILDAIPAPIFFKDAAGVYQGCNEAFCEYLGHPYEHIVGHTVFDIAPADKAEVYEAADRKLLQQGGVQIYEAQVRFADGSDRDVVFHKAVYRNADGSVGGLVGNMLDVTEIRRAEAELAESELNYREIFNASSEAIIIRDLKTGKVLDVNQAMLDMYGYTYDEALLTTIEDLSSGEPPYTIEKAYEHISRAKKGEHMLFEWRAKNKDGTRFWVEISLQQSQIRGEPRIIAVIRDITERRLAEQAQRESEERFNLLVEHAADALFLHDTEGCVLTVNQRSCDWLGYRREELLGMNVADFEKGVSREKLRDFWDSLEVGSSASIEGNHTRKDGSRFPVDVNVVKFRFHGADFFLALVRDVTERRATEEELARYRNRLEELVRERTRQLEEAQDELVQKERMAVLGQLTATVSHELRNPLGTVKNAIHILGRLMELGDSAKVGNALDLAGRNINRCDGIINELLDYTRQQEWTPVEIDLGDWLKEVLDEQDTPEDIKVTRNCKKGTIVACDPERLRRVIINVYNNAVQALQETDARKRLLRISIEETDEQVNLLFQDNGPGMDEDVLARIFEPMFSTKSFGVGLGMPIVRNIMEEHHGGVEIESCYGKGTTVRLWLPHSKEGPSAKL